MADTVLTELKIHEFDSVEQMSQYESEIGENDLAFTPDMTAETLNGKADVGFGNVSNIAKELMANSSMPSGTYKDLTLGSSGSKYTAPADGWVAINKVGTASGQWVSMTSNNMGSQSSIQGANGTGVCYLPVKKGDEFKVSYSLSGTTNFFRFIYAEGSKHLA